MTHDCRTLNVHCPECVPGAAPAGVTYAVPAPKLRDEAPRTQPERDEWTRSRLKLAAVQTFALLMATQSRRDMSQALRDDIANVMEMLRGALEKHQKRLDREQVVAVKESSDG